MLSLPLSLEALLLLTLELLFEVGNGLEQVPRRKAVKGALSDETMEQGGRSGRVLGGSKAEALWNYIG